MTIVSYRPPIVTEVEKYTLEQRKRLMVRPDLHVSGKFQGEVTCHLRFSSEWTKSILDPVHMD